MAYVEQSEMTDYLRSTIIADEADIQAALLAAQSTVDAYCGRTFTVPTTATARTFVVDDPYVVTVPDIANSTNLAIVDAGTTISASYFQLEISPNITGPISVSGRTWPYTRIRRLSGTWGISSVGDDTLSITARWGWAAVPPEVALSTKLLCRDYLLARDTGFGLTQTGDGYLRRIAGNSVVESLLAPLRRAEVAMGIAG